jgi:type II secretory pathway component GspD/PulD (secretin)
MKGLLLTLALFLQNPAPPSQQEPPAQLQPAATGPISLELNQTSRVAYETLAELAGLNVIFDPDFRTVFTPFRVDKVDILDALNRLSLQTGSFITVLDTKTIIVAPNNQTKRRDYDTLVFKTFYLAKATAQPGLTSIVTTLRATLGVRYIAMSTSRNAILIRDTPDRIAAAERIISTSVLTTSAPLDTGNETAGLPASRAFRKMAPSQFQLEVKTQGAITINTNEDSRATYETLADMAGLNIVFDRDWQSTNVALKLQNAGILDALDFLSLQTRSFWEVLDSKTILVSPDNQTKRRTYTRTFVKAIPLASVTTQLEITEIVTALRTLLNLRYIAQVPAINTIVIHDTASRLAFAEKLVADLDKPSGNQASVPAALLPFDAGSETGGILRSRAFRKMSPAPSPLDSKATRSLTLDMTEDIRQSYERLAKEAGLNVVFKERFQNAAAGRFRLKDVDAVDALDFLALQTGTFWQFLDSATIVVAPDNQTTRRDLEPRTAKTIPLTGIQTPAGAGEILTALRTLLNTREVASAPNAIVMRDTPENIALAERLIADLAKTN